MNQMGSMFQFEIIGILIALAALLVFFIAYKLLANKGWVLGWLRGTCGMLLVLLTGAIVVFMLDIRTYRPMFDEHTIATINVVELSQGQFQLRIVDVDGIETRYGINGSRWAILINQYKWSTRFVGLGLGHGYRFRSLIGLDEMDRQLAEVELSRPEHTDSWQWVNQNLPSDFFISAALVKSKPMKLASGAIYEVIPLANNILIKPVNDIAINANTAANNPAGKVQEEAPPLVNEAAVPAVQDTATPTL